ncbi:hypothetical protein PsYK624_119500 [Phanerochaete sordida]|uniref:Uncharacterized protein n=1 Tax=Phanerochaete sordida TaxID=48140 RepID=A0A9P3GGW4_9APHY|nr:hypothetical protein PsYK624_119500 [Phanerochaete sordida]
MYSTAYTSFLLASIFLLATIAIPASACYGTLSPVQPRHDKALQMRKPDISATSSPAVGACDGCEGSHMD